MSGSKLQDSTVSVMKFQEHNRSFKDAMDWILSGITLHVKHTYKMAKIAAVYIMCFIRLTLFITATQCCSECSLHWHSYNGNCYLMIEDRKPFWDAEGYCKSLSRQGREAHLVSIANQQEEDFIKWYAQSFDFTKFIWTGFALNQATMEWYWIDGNQALYRGWNLGNPNDLNGRCTVLSNLEYWANRACFNTYPFICKIPSRYGNHLH